MDALSGTQQPEGRFELKAPKVKRRKVNTQALECESNIQVSIIDFHKSPGSRSYYFIHGEPPIAPLLSQDCYMGDYMRHLREGKGDPVLRWIHLPANNMSWVEIMVSRIYSERLSKCKHHDSQTTEQAKDSNASEPPTVEQTADPDDSGPSTMNQSMQSDIPAQHHAGQQETSPESVKPFLLLPPALWDERQWTAKTPEEVVPSRFLRPVYARISTETKKPDEQERWSSDREAGRNHVLFMPYINWEAIEMYSLRNKCLGWMLHRGHPDGEHFLRPISAERRFKASLIGKNLIAEKIVDWNRSAFLEIQKQDVISSLPIHAKLLMAYAYDDPPLHIRRTLDQSYYHTLPEHDIKLRDLDQVLFRHTLSLDMDTRSQILMVDQLWLWVIEEPGIPKTILTAFPPRWEKSRAEAIEDRTNVYNKIFSSLRTVDVDITSATDLACLIIDKCSSLFHPNADEAAQSLNYLQVFSLAIGTLSDAQTKQADEILMSIDRLVALRERREQLYQASIGERLFGTTKSEDTGATGQHNPGSAGIEKRISEIPEAVESITFRRRGKKPLLGTSSETKPLEAGFDKAAATAWFRDTAEQEIKRPDPLKNLTVLKTGTRFQLENEIEREMSSLVSITAESRSLQEIKDILDELNSIHHVFLQQIKVIREAIAANSPSQNDETEEFADEDHEDSVDVSQNGKERARSRTEEISTKTQIHPAQAVCDRFEKVLVTLRHREQDIVELKNEATRVYNSICDLLDLKQKQASVFEAYYARQEARESAKQGQTILIFTVVTIVFLPLSFIAAIFSMNASEINGVGLRSVGDIFKIMFPTTIAVLAISLVFAFYTYIWWVVFGMWNYLRSSKAKIKDAAEDLKELKQLKTRRRSEAVMTDESGAGSGRSEEIDEKRTDDSVDFFSVRPKMADSFFERNP